MVDLRIRPSSSAAKGTVSRRRQRSDEWTGYCGRCEDETTLSVVKCDGRWTLRQIFSSSWSENDFDVTCRRCGGRWPTKHGAAMSLPDWLEQTRGARGSQGD